MLKAKPTLAIRGKSSNKLQIIKCSIVLLIKALLRINFMIMF